MIYEPDIRVGDKVRFDMKRLREENRGRGACTSDMLSLMRRDLSEHAVVAIREPVGYPSAIADAPSPPLRAFEIAGRWEYWLNIWVSHVNGVPVKQSVTERECDVTPDDGWEF